MVENNRVERRWGYYEVIKELPGIKIKYICLYPNKSISLQYHEHRTEYWHHISGTGFITGWILSRDEIGPLNENTDLELLSNNFLSNTFDRDDNFMKIEVGCVHKLTNNSETDNLTLVEVQTGDILSEEDIVRLEEIEGPL